MDPLEAWLVVGVPALVISAALFVGHSALRGAAGYVVLAATLVFFLLVPDDRVSAALVGFIGVFLLAAGRGYGEDVTQPEHHETRRRYTTTDGPG